MTNEILLDLINGSNISESYTIEGIPKPLPLRPLVNRELAELRKLEKGASKGLIKMDVPMDAKKREKAKDRMQKMEQEINYADMEESKYKVMRKAVCLSADVDEKDYDKLPPRVAENIFAKVMEISQITEDELDLLKNFRKE